MLYFMHIGVHIYGVFEVKLLEIKLLEMKLFIDKIEEYNPTIWCIYDHPK